MLTIMDKYNYIKKYKNPNFEYPMEELKHILSSFKGLQITRDLNYFIEGKINSLKHRLLNEFIIPESEIEYFRIVYTLGEITEVKCGNIFTACLLFDHYIPILLLGEACSVKDVTFYNGDHVFYDNVSEGYFLELGNNTSTTIMDEYQCLSLDELQENCRGLSGDEFKVAYSLVEKKINELLEIFKKENPGVPTDATEIVNGKNYSGRADDDFEIRTINNKIWFIPLGGCVDFGEDY